MTYWKIRAGSSGKYWPSWEEKEIITIGWDIRDISDLGKKEIKRRVEEKYPGDNPGQVGGMLRSFAGLRSNSAKNMKKGEYVIVLGSANVRAVAELKEFRYEPEGIPENKSHTYYRDVNFVWEGPVRIRDLPQKFQQGGDGSLHLWPTLQRYKVDQETFEELLDTLEDTPTYEVKPGYLVDFTEEALQNYIRNRYEDLDEGIAKIEDEYPTTVGDADFKCLTNNDKILVIETKIGTATDSAVGQLLGYMNAIREKEEKKVRGLLIAEGFTDRVKKAAQSIDFTLKTFQAKLKFSTI